MSETLKLSFSDESLLMTSTISQTLLAAFLGSPITTSLSVNRSKIELFFTDAKALSLSKVFAPIPRLGSLIILSNERSSEGF